jgi:hypothetical protein
MHCDAESAPSMGYQRLVSMQSTMASSHISRLFFVRADRSRSHGGLLVTIEKENIELALWIAAFCFGFLGHLVAKAALLVHCFAKDRLCFEVRCSFLFRR